MNTDADLRAGATGQQPSPSGQEPARSGEPPAIQFKMPGGQAGRHRESARGGQPAAMDAVEDLMHRLMSRLDENDRRYSHALGDLNQRLTQLSERAQSVRATQPEDSGAALDRVREQADLLAAQITQAGSAHRTQNQPVSRDFARNMGGFSSANDDLPHPDFGDARLNSNFAEITEQLEHSLDARAPANEFDALSQRMDELAHRFDAALATRNDLAALQKIESQLGALTAGFAEARQNYARVEAIESHLHNLMNWAQTGGTASHSGSDERLEAIEQALHALGDNTREMDARTVSTLEAMNEALHTLAHQPGPCSPPYHEPPRTPQLQQPRDDHAEVWIKESSELGHGSSPPASVHADHVGATIPDYQPAPGKAGRNTRTETHGRDHTPAVPASPQPRIEPGFEADSDFIASARRAAAAAAAQQPAPKPAARASRFRRPLAEMAGEPLLSGEKRTRPLVVAAAIGLMLVSAALLYARFKDTPAEPPALGQSQQHTPQPPAAAPAPPPGVKPAPDAPVQKPPAVKKKQSERMPDNISGPEKTAQTAPAQQPNAPAVPQTSQQTLAQAATSAVTVDPDRPISTATLLASLPSRQRERQADDLTMSIKEPAARGTASAAGIASVTPALVPPAETQSRPAPLPLPKRAPAAAPARPNPADSAPANEAAPAADQGPTSMPPLRIGPQSLRMAAARGNPEAQVEVASRFAKGVGVDKDLQQAAKWYHRAAAQGHAPGQYRLAALYERGHGVKQDTGMARTWYRRAAELGNVRAMHNLAVLYTRAGKGGPDYTAAKNWFYQAARYGLADSQFNLGILYESGLGVKKNTAEAYKWFSLAARQGDTEAQKRREALRPQLPARSLAAAEQAIRKWKPAGRKEEANRTGAPDGGWQNALTETPGQATDTALVARAQTLLNKLGYDAGVPDGKLGPQTLAAIRRFEERSGAPGTGAVTPGLLRRLEALSG